VTHRRRGHAVFQRNFKFVNLTDTDPKTRREAQCHAMREWKRGKKWTSLQRLRSGTQSPISGQMRSIGTSPKLRPAQLDSIRGAPSAHLQEMSHKHEQASHLREGLPPRRPMARIRGTRMMSCKLLLTVIPCQSRLTQGYYHETLPQRPVPARLSPFSTVPIRLSGQCKTLTHACKLTEIF